MDEKDKKKTPEAPPTPTHVSGVSKGEETLDKKGQDAGRQTVASGKTGVNPKEPSGPKDPNAPPPVPTHVSGVSKGEETLHKKGQDAGRQTVGSGKTGIDPKEPTDPKNPN